MDIYFEQNAYVNMLYFSFRTILRLFSFLQFLNVAQICLTIITFNSHVQFLQIITNITLVLLFHKPTSPNKSSCHLNAIYNKLIQLSYTNTPLVASRLINYQLICRIHNNCDSARIQDNVESA